MKLSETIVGVTLAKLCSVSEDDTVGGPSKSITLKVKFDGSTLQSVFDKAMSSTVIAWQTKARKQFASLKDGGVVEIQFIAPTRVTVDPETAMKSMLASLTEADRITYINKLMAEAKALAVKPTEAKASK